MVQGQARGEGRALVGLDARVPLSAQRSGMKEDVRPREEPNLAVAVLMPYIMSRRTSNYIVMEKK